MAYIINKMDEEFYNPFDEINKLKKPKKPKKMADPGGLLKPRREIFNINRVAYSKRPGGDYTVMARKKFAKGEIIEICPIIFVGMEAKAIDKLKDYIFEIEKTGTKGGMWGVVLGYGSLYKHSDTPNVEFAYNRSNKQMYFIAARTIQAHEELSINYGKDYWEERRGFKTIAPENETPAAGENDLEEGDGQPQAPSNIPMTGLTGIKGNPSKDGVATMGGGQS